MNRKVRNTLSLISICLGGFLCGCSGDVGTVKDGMLNGYQTTTIGKAFDSSFGSTSWESKKSDKGVAFVEFSGDVDSAFWVMASEELLKSLSNEALGLKGYDFVSQCFTDADAKWIVSSYFGVAMLGELSGFDGGEAYSQAMQKVTQRMSYTWHAYGRPARFVIQFTMTPNKENSPFYISYFGMKDWNKCDLFSFVHLKTLLDFIYSDKHTYKKLGPIEAAKKEIVNKEAPAMDSSKREAAIDTVLPTLNLDFSGKANKIVPG